MKRRSLAPALLLSLIASSAGAHETSTPQLVTEFRPVEIPAQPAVSIIRDRFPVTEKTRPSVDIPDPSPIHTSPSIRTPSGTYPADVMAARAYALGRIGATQFACLDTLWYRESRWRTTAKNKSSGAYGIPQALPGTKMAKAGADWLTNPLTQVKWGLGYISGRYGTACRALEHSYARGWY